MGFLDALFGRTRLKRPQMDRLFALVTAQVSLAERAGWLPAGRAGVCLKPVSASDFAQAQQELTDLVRLAAKDTATQVQVRQDAYHYTWVLLADPDFEDLVTLVHLAGQELLAHGYGEQLLSAVFRFFPAAGAEANALGTARPLYLIYNYKRGAFYPFAPIPRGARVERPRFGPDSALTEERDNPEELRLSAVMARELPIETDLSRWYALWDCPV